MVSPAAVLVATMSRVLATVPPWVVLPPLVGGGPGGSLNLFVAIAGEPEDGKDAALDLAADVVQLPATRWAFSQPTDPNPYTAPLGSGEGLAHQYAHRAQVRADPDDAKNKTMVSVVERLRDSVIFQVSEVGTLTKTSARSASTIIENLCLLWTASKHLGAANADKDRTVPVAPHTYRACLQLLVQPRKAKPLFAAEDGGLPQRFVWASAVDRTAPELDETDDSGATPPPYVMPDQRWHLARPRTGGYLVLPVPPEVRLEIRRIRNAKLRGVAADGFIGHLTFSREKIAQALAILNGRRVMTGEDWELAGMIIDQSEIVRASIDTALADVDARGNLAKGLAAGHAQVAANSVIKDAEAQELAAAAERVRVRILAAFDDGATCTRGRLRSDRFKESERDAFDTAWVELVDKHLIVPDGARWRRA